MELPIVSLVMYTCVCVVSNRDSSLLPNTPYVYASNARKLKVIFLIFIKLEISLVRKIFDFSF